MPNFPSYPLVTHSKTLHIKISIQILYTNTIKKTKHYWLNASTNVIDISTYGKNQNHSY